MDERKRNAAPQRNAPPRPFSNEAMNMHPNANAGRRKAPAPRKKPKKEPVKLSPLVTVFLVVLAIAILIIIAQFFKKDSNFDIMKLFETEPPKYDTSAVANIKEPTGGVVFASEDENTTYLDIASSNGILIDLKTNTVIATKKGDERIYPASMTKVMTLIVAYEHIEDLNDTFTFTFDIVNDAYVAGASVAGFSEGETVPLIDLLYGTVLPSGADATSALAQYVAGSEEEFANLMNFKVEEMGLRDTHFVTASGLHDDNHYSTCHDMAKILEYAIATPELRQILGTYKYTTTPTSYHPNGITLHSTMYSKMVGDEPGNVYVQGGKTGYTPEAHNCLASFAAVCTEEDYLYTLPEYILVTAGGIGEYAPIYDAIDAYKKYAN